MIDKIVQITHTFDPDGSDAILGLSESGRLYEINFSVTGESHWVLLSRSPGADREPVSINSLISGQKHDPLVK